MTDSSQHFHPPTAKSLIKSTAACFLVALVVLILAVLPAEYHLDPTGLGEKLGLMEISEGSKLDSSYQKSSELKDADLTTKPAYVIDTNLIGDIDQNVVTSPYEPSAIADSIIARLDAQAPPQKTVTIKLAPEQQLEYKVTLAKGEPLLYSWQADQGEVYTDFHGQPHEGPEGYWMRYGESESDSAHGKLVAPFTGEHGWFWLNYSDVDVTITLTFTGYYSWAGFFEDES